MSIPPAILILAGLAGYVGDLFGSETERSLRKAIVEGLGSFLDPSTMRDFVRPAVDDLFARGRADILSIGAVLALWSASRVTRVFMETLNHAFGLPKWRTGWRRRLAALALTFLGLVVLAVALPFIVAGPRLGKAIADNSALPSQFGTVWAILYWPVAVAVGVALLVTVYHAAPNKRTRWRDHVPGALVAAATWIAAAFGLRLYVSVAFDRGSAFGPLGAPIILLLWLYVSAFAVLVGAELNATLERDRALVKENEDSDDPAAGSDLAL